MRAKYTENQPNEYSNIEDTLKLAIELGNNSNAYCYVSDGWEFDVSCFL